MIVTALKKSKLLAVAPETVEPKKPKILIYGKGGVGKTWASLEWPSCYYIDCEAGADLAHYRSKLQAAGAMYFGPDQGSLSFTTVIEQVEALATEKHSYRTIIIDSITKLFSAAIADEQLRMANEGKKDEFGSSKRGPIRQMQQLLRWINRADMNVVLIAHEKEEWGKSEKGEREVIGHTFDAWEKLLYELHLILRITKIGTGANSKRFAIVGKSRLESFPEGDRFNWSYAEFAERYGRDVIEKAAQAIILATPDQVAEVKRLLEVVKFSEADIAKWFAKANVESWEEFDSEKIEKCIAALRTKMTDAK